MVYLFLGASVGIGTAVALGKDDRIKRCLPELLEHVEVHLQSLWCLAERVRRGVNQ